MTLGNRVVEADYVVIGGGASGMAFADALVANSNATVAIIDRNCRPGGHWTNSYPFVQLHLPSHMYGVASQPLGDCSIYTEGDNSGLLHMASGTEILAYYQRVMEKTLIASGRVTYLPMTEYLRSGHIHSRLTGAHGSVRAHKKLVDATYCEIGVPSTHLRPFHVEPGAICIPINDIVQLQRPFQSYCVIGGGKTGMDACLWMLRHGVRPESIIWVMPRDAWWMNREKLQFSVECPETSIGFLVDQMEALSQANDVEDLFLRFEKAGLCFRIDENIVPSMYHGASATRSEVVAVRRIRSVRMGHVRSISPTLLEMADGRIEVPADTLFIDCSAAGAPSRPPTQIFERESIILQWVKAVRPTFSAALIGFVESATEDNDKKNKILAPISPPRTPDDWPRMLSISLKNQQAWSAEIDIMQWINTCRLDPTSAILRSVVSNETFQSQVQKLRTLSEAGALNLGRLLQKVDMIFSVAST